ncbi:MAG: hypothetical protein AAF585_03415 [Verrucomicrobiota bacterium]
MQHRLREDAPLSDYDIPQLMTYVAPEGREATLWVAPGGNRYVFDNKSILKEVPEELGEGWTCVSSGIGNYQFLSGDGWEYVYKFGTLQLLKAPTGRSLRFETAGVRIQRIFQSVNDEELELLSAALNDAGSVIELKIGAKAHRFDWNEDTGRLAAWRPAGVGESAAKFHYENGLLSKIDLPGGESLEYKWKSRLDSKKQENSGLDLPDGEGPGAFLFHDGIFQYHYGINREGINLIRFDKTNVSDGIAWNPRTKQLIIRNRDGGEITRLYGVRGAENGLLSSVRDPEGRLALSVEYDEKGRIASRKQLGGPAVTFKYDELDRIKSVHRLDRRERYYEYDGKSGRPSKIVNADDDSTEFKYNKAGQVVSYKGLEGDEHEFIYDDLGKLVEHKYPYGYNETWKFDDHGRLTEHKAMNGRISKRTFDEDGKLKEIADGGAVWNYEYDQDGDLKRLLRDGETWQQVERKQLTESGEEIVKSVDPFGNETVLHLDDEGNVAKEVNALGQETEFRYDELGQLTGWTDPRGVVADFERDVIGRVVGLENAEGPTLGLTYDKSGRIVERNTPEQNIKYQYDREGRLKLIDYGGGETVTYEYDEYGRIKVGATPEVKTHYNYDDLNRVTRKHEVILEEHSSTLVYEWSPSGRKASLAIFRNGEDPEHRLQKTDYHYDLLGRYSSIYVDGEEKVTYEYFEDTLRLKQKNFWNGMVVHYDWDEAGRPAVLKAVEEDGLVTKDVSYQWSDKGKLDVRIIDGVQENYYYDELGRLIAVIRNTLEEIAQGASTKPDPKVFEDLRRKAEEAQKRVDAELDATQN